MNTSTAILFFSRSSVEEASAKNWLPGKNKKNQLLAKQLIKQTLAEAKKTNLPIFIVDSAKQTGQSFGEKFSNAIESVFNKGIQNVIAIGSDCPRLTAADIQKAYDISCQGNMVLGPDTRGGVYLLGLNKNNFNPQRFQQLPWQTSNLITAIINYAAETGGTTTALRRLDDFHLNVTISSASLLKKVLLLPLLKTVISLLTPGYHLPSFGFSYSPLSVVYCKGLRAPPYCIL
ncbi:MAG: DUF2064 domain-containing protein [Ferruginibacter sp.]